MFPQVKRITSLFFYFQLVFFLFFLIFSNSTLAQNGTIFIRADKGIAYTDTGVKIRFKKMRETENSFSFITSNKTKIEKDKIAQIEKRNGTRGLQYTMTAIGGSCLLVIHSSYVRSFYSLGRFRSTYEGELLFVSIFLSTITGTVAGLIGLSKKRYKTIYTAPSFGINEPHLKLKTTLPNAIPSLTLSYTF